MRIGIDFDNTIANYHGVFHAVAVKQGWLDSDAALDKKGVKQTLIAESGENKWTELQGLVYGKDIYLADSYSGFKHFILAMKKQGHDLFIVSHKTRFPVIGEKVSLHDAARNWLIQKDLIGGMKQHISVDHVYFELTQTDKVNRVAQLDLDFFIDDLPEFLGRADFPKRTQRILFDPDGHLTEDQLPELLVSSSWVNIEERLHDLD